MTAGGHGRPTSQPTGGGEGRPSDTPEQAAELLREGGGSERERGSEGAKEGASAAASIAAAAARPQSLPFRRYCFRAVVVAAATVHSAQPLGRLRRHLPRQWEAPACQP